MTAAFALALATVWASAEPLPLLDVPFVTQTEALCGGAAISMVMRYWGAVDVQAADFATLVDDSRGGIATGELLTAARARGFRAWGIRGTPELVQEHVSRGRPVVLLIRSGAAAYHYVVVVAWQGENVIYHDPAVGPFRVAPAASLIGHWEPAEYWAMLILPTSALPDADAVAGAPGIEPAPVEKPGACSDLINLAVTEARSGALDSLAQAERQLRMATILCPQEARSWRELAGVRFRAENWREAAEFAQRAVHLDTGDEHAWRVLATSRFLDGDEMGALRAWNAVGEPQLDLIDVTGFDRTRRDLIDQQLGLQPRDVLDERSLRRAERRVRAMPTTQAARVSYAPLGQGRARLDVAVLERRLFDPWRLLLADAAIDALTQRETRMAVSGLTGNGERLGVGGRWWRRRPAAWLTMSTPRGLGLPGVTRLVARWDRQTYAAVGGTLEEVRAAASLTSERWWTPDLRVRWGVGLDDWRDRPLAVSLQLGVDHRLAGDRVALFGEGSAWWPDGASRFAAGSVRIAVRSDARQRRLSVWAGMGYHASSATAPLALWPGAGTGQGRTLLLRAHPLIDDGIVTGAGFGRALLQGNLETRLELWHLGPIAFGVAAFADAARVWDRPDASGVQPWLMDVGAGVRVLLPASSGALRLDVARSVSNPASTSGDGGWVLSAAWLPAWPR